MYSIAEANDLGLQLREACKKGEEIWIRLAGPIHEPLTTIARCGLPALILVGLSESNTDFWKKQGDLLGKTVGTPAGVVTIGDTPWRRH